MQDQKGLPREPLAGTVAVVTGASSGVGLALARALGARGVRLGVVSRRRERLEPLAAELASKTSVCCFQADLTRDEDIRGIQRAVEKEFGRLDWLIHSAGVISMARLECAAVEGLDQHYATNLRAPFLLTQAVLPMLRLGTGAVVFINSTAGLHPRPNLSQYVATKHALRGLADSLRDEINAEGIRVLNVYLGRTATPMQRSVHEMEGRPYRPERLIQPEEAAQIIVGLLEPRLSVEVTSVTLRPFLAPRRDEPADHKRVVESEGVLIRDWSGCIAFWNRGAERLYGWRPEECVGRPSHALFETEFPQPLQQIHAELEQTGVWEGQLVHRRRDGTRIRVRSRWELQLPLQSGPPLVLEINREIGS